MTRAKRQYAGACLNTLSRWSPGRHTGPFRTRRRLLRRRRVIPVETPNARLDDIPRRRLPATRPDDRPRHATYPKTVKGDDFRKMPWHGIHTARSSPMACGYAIMPLPFDYRRYAIYDTVILAVVHRRHSLPVRWDLISCRGRWDLISAPVGKKSDFFGTPRGPIKLRKKQKKGGVPKGTPRRVGLVG